MFGVNIYTMNNIKTYEGFKDMFSKEQVIKKIIKELSSLFLDYHSQGERSQVSPVGSAGLIITLNNNPLDVNNYIKDSKVVIQVVFKSDELEYKIKCNKILKDKLFKEHKIIEKNSEKKKIDFNRFIPINLQKKKLKKISKDLFDDIINFYQKIKPELDTAKREFTKKEIEKTELSLKQASEKRQNLEKKTELRNKFIQDTFAKYDEDIKDFLYDLKDEIGEYTISKFTDSKIGYLIEWKDSKIFRTDGGSNDIENTINRLKLLKEFAYRVKSEFDLDIYYNDKSIKIILDEIPSELIIRRSIRRAPRF
jgi:hypothetical protein